MALAASWIRMWIMPRSWPAATVVSLLLGACKVQDFAWQDEAPPRLSAYKQAFHQQAGDRWNGEVGWAEFLAAVARTRILWLGDDHRDAQLHALQLDLLQRLHAAGLPLALGLEAIGEQDQPVVDDYLRGSSDQQHLRTAIRWRWPGSWLDDPEVDHTSYRRLLTMARDRGWPLFALEPTPRLRLGIRDAAIAGNVRAAAARHHDRLLVVVIGQAHLLGAGDLLHRCGLPGIAIGATPSPQLQAVATECAATTPFRRSSGGLLF